MKKHIVIALIAALPLATLADDINIKNMTNCVCETDGPNIQCAEEPSDIGYTIQYGTYSNNICTYTGNSIDPNEIHSATKNCDGEDAMVSVTNGQNANGTSSSTGENNFVAISMRSKTGFINPIAFPASCVTFSTNNGEESCQFNSDTCTAES